MTERGKLIEAETEAMVAEWGEAERAAARRMATSKTTAQLRFNARLRADSTHTGPTTTKIARGCLDEGAS